MPLSVLWEMTLFNTQSGGYIEHRLEFFGLLLEKSNPDWSVVKDVWILPPLSDLEVWGEGVVLIRLKDNLFSTRNCNGRPPGCFTTSSALIMINIPL